MRGSLVISVVALIVGVLIGTFIPSLGPATMVSNEDSDGEAATAGGGIGDPVRWKMASTFPGSLTLLGEAGLRLESRLALISNGEIEVKFFEPGALVPAFEVFDAVSAGSVDAGWSSSGYWAGICRHS